MVLARKDFDLSQCPLMAQSGHPSRAQQCPLLGVKRTSRMTGQQTKLVPHPPLGVANYLARTLKHVGFDRQCPFIRDCDGLSQPGRHQDLGYGTLTD
jgi:hypothetical protein